MTVSVHRPYYGYVPSHCELHPLNFIGIEMFSILNENALNFRCKLNNNETADFEEISMTLMEML